MLKPHSALKCLLSPTHQLTYAATLSWKLMKLAKTLTWLFKTMAMVTAMVTEEIVTKMVTAKVVEGETVVETAVVDMVVEMEMAVEVAVAVAKMVEAETLH